ncbi:hypothetical protein B7755_039415 [Streptomyces sp. NBS 14/10]|uniref:hypothetical protein n=1 Tax=Streptomyces sp. NBS 14/10 TaxID=1945643 RepID=UPI0015C5CED7|nr:hypothetical protein [Streptomyces sp. NBS 14/10]KAK1183670.1 hypothetical protein B7755_039415 [Streptomyces sp. NBS 14/10]
MERAATGVETELVDLSGTTLEELGDSQEFTLATQRLLKLVQSPPTLSTSAANQQGC